MPTRHPATLAARWRWCVDAHTAPRHDAGAMGVDAHTAPRHDAGAIAMP
jgi:hypothetical protein